MAVSAATIDPAGTPASIAVTYVARERAGAYSLPKVRAFGTAPPNPSPARNRYSANSPGLVIYAVIMEKIPKNRAERSSIHFASPTVPEHTQSNRADQRPELTGGQCKAESAGFNVQKGRHLRQRHSDDKQIEAIEQHDKKTQKTHEQLVRRKTARLKNFTYGYLSVRHPCPP